MKIQDFEVKPTDRCPICKVLFAEGEPCFRGHEVGTGKVVTVHALCVLRTVKSGDGVFGRQPVGLA